MRDLFIYLLGGIDTPLIVFLIINLYVYITSWCKVIMFHKMNTKAGFKGLIRIIGLIIVVSLASLLDKIMGSMEAIRLIVIYFFIAREGLVLLKSWCAMGLPLPKKIVMTLENLIKEEDSNEKEIRSEE